MLYLVTGGAACGKSEFAEKICMSLPTPRYYIATMQPYGKEGEARVKKHRAMREGKFFVTIERYTDFEGLFIPERGTVLLECIGNLTANEMFAEDIAKDSTERVLRGIESVLSQCDNLVLVTNEVGSDGTLYDESTMLYISALGRINAYLAQKADSVYELVAGIPIKLKGEMAL